MWLQIRYVTLSLHGSNFEYVIKMILDEEDEMNNGGSCTDTVYTTKDMLSRIGKGNVKGC